MAKLKLFTPLETLETRPDLNQLLIEHPAATFFMKSGSDILVVDKSIKPSLDKWVVAIIDGEFVLKQITPKSNFEIWGVVTYIIRPLCIS